MICIDTKDGQTQHAFGKEAAHLVSDVPGQKGTEELLDFARQIGCRGSWIQFRGQPKEHFDVWGTKLKAALRSGAEEVGAEGLVKIIQSKRGQEG